MSCIGFGVFEFDPQTGALTRDGRPVRLQPQPARAFGALLAARGGLVSRDQLRVAIWGADTFVEVDSGLNFCISQLRSALGDSADSPRYVATIPRQGYRFLAPIRAAPAPAPNRRNWAIGAAATAIIVLALGGVFFTSKDAIDQPATIAVARFDNESGDRSLDRLADGISDSLVADLAADGRFQVIGNAAILRVARDERDLAKIASELNAGFVILGQIERDASRVRVLAHLIRLPDQKHITAGRFHGEFEDALSAEEWFATQIQAEFGSFLDSQESVKN